MAEPHEILVLPDAEAVARRGADVVAEVIREGSARRGSFALAVSGGRTPLRMFAHLPAEDLSWARGGIWQVDERVAPEGHPDRNLTGLLANLPTEARSVVHPMPVTEDDLEAASARYASGLPDPFDVVHLGLGPDGHTASSVPGDPVLDVTDRDVAVTGVYRGRRRMTFTFPLLNRSPFVLWLISGSDKAEALERMLALDPSIPAGRVRSPRQLVLVDEAAAARVGPS